MNVDGNRIVLTFAEAECLIALAQLTQDRSAHENAVVSDLITCVTDVLCAEVAALRQATF